MMQFPRLVRVRALALACGAVLAAGPASAQFGAEHVVTSGGPDLTDIDVADLDGDGDLDVLATHDNDPPVTWHRNLGGGVFGGAIALHPAPSFFERSSQFGRTVDYDSDGDLDIVVDMTYYHPSVGQSFYVEVYKNAGDGSFSDAASYPIIFTTMSGLAVADLENDGDDDVFYGAWGDASVLVLRPSHGALPFTPALVTDDALAPTQVLPQDLDGDSDADLVVTSSQTNSVAWYENPGSLPFGPRQVISNVANGVGAVSAADLDGDADVDIVAGGSSSGIPHLRWYENDGGGFTPHPVTIGTTFPASLRAADLDDDGDQDLLVGELHGVSWYANDGQGQFGPRQPIGGTTFLVQGAHPADIDGDSVPDVLAGANPDFQAEIVWFPSLLTAPWTNLLSGLDGVLGVPALVGTGTLETGSAGSLVLSAAAPSAFGMLLASLTSTPAAFKCGTLVPVPVLMGFPVLTGAAGALPVAWGSWPGGLSGASLHLQYAIADAAAPCGVSLSNALRADVP